MLVQRKSVRSKKILKSLPVRLISFELCLFLLTIVLWYLLKRLLNFNIDDEYLVDAVFIVGFLDMLIARSAGPRFFWHGFSSIFLSAVASALEATQVTFLVSSLAVSFLTLGVINMLLFRGKDK